MNWCLAKKTFLELASSHPVVHSLESSWVPVCVWSAGSTSSRPSRSFTSVERFEVLYTF